MEIERREANYQNIQAQLSTMESYKIQMENFKRQVGILEEKLKLYEGEFSHKNIFLSEQLKTVSDAENKLRNQVINKDKIIQEFDSIIKEQEKQINFLKKQNIEKDKICDNFKQDFNEISLKFKNLSIKFSTKEEELKRYKDELENKYHDSLNEKKNLEDKLSQLIVIVKQYSNETAELNGQLQSLDNERKNLLKLNNNLKEDLEECYNKNKELSEQLSELKIVKNKLIEADNYLNDLEDIVNKERQKNENLNRINLDLAEKLDDIMDRHSGENSLENLRKIIDNRENEIFNLQQSIDNITKMAKSVDNKFLEIDAENKEILNGLNNEFNSISQWIETYLCSYLDNNFEIPDLPSTISKYIKNKTKIDTVKDCLNKSREKLNREFYKYENVIKDLKDEYNDLLRKHEGQNYEISQIKTEILKKNEELFIYNQEVEEIKNSLGNCQEILNKQKLDFNEKQDNYFKFIEKLLSVIKREIEEIQANDKLRPFYEFLYKKNFTESFENQLENNLEKLIYILNGLIKEYLINFSKNEDVQKIKFENDKLRKDLIDKTKYFREEVEKLLFEKEEIVKILEKNKMEDLKLNESVNKSALEKMRSKIVEKDEINLQTQHENNLLRSQLEVMEKNMGNYQNMKKENDNDLKEKFEKINENYKILEKKHKNMLTEIELKDMQINSQEQMINRRTQEIQEYKNKIDNQMVNSSNDIRETEKEKFKTLEVIFFNLFLFSDG